MSGQKWQCKVVVSLFHELSPETRRKLIIGIISEYGDFSENIFRLTIGTSNCQGGRSFSTLSGVTIIYKQQWVTQGWLMCHLCVGPMHSELLRNQDLTEVRGHLYGNFD